MKNDDDLTTRQLLRIIEHSLPRSWLSMRVYERTLGSEPRTTNFLEGWHHRISSILGQVYPNIWKFLEFLKGGAVKYRIKEASSPLWGIFVQKI